MEIEISLILGNSKKRSRFSGQLKSKLSGNKQKQVDCWAKKQEKN